MDSYIMAIDAGTTGITIHLYDHNVQLVQKAYSEFPQYYPQSGWVEQDGQEIWETTLRLIQEFDLQTVSAIGITNQRETILAWHKETSKPLSRAIVWQCRRTASICQQLERKKEIIRSKTGLVLDAYFSATKIKWLKDNVPEVSKAFRENKALVGTIDSWLLWKLTKGKVHSTDHTNASRTMLYNIHKKCWDPELLELFEVPQNVLPSVHHSAHHFGDSDESLLEKKIPITGIAGDQQAALFGQKCVERGQFKNTYGTGCFLMVNTGEMPILSSAGLLTTLACNKEGKPAYALEGSVFIGGAVIQWLRDGLKILEKAEDSEGMALLVEDSGGLCFLPAFTGMGAPYWDMDVRGTLFGITRGTTRAHIVRSALEAIVFQTKNLIHSFQKDCPFEFQSLRVDGGAVSNNLLMEMQADVLGMDIIRPQNIETTALGVAYLAGLGSGFWSSFEELQTKSEEVTIFSPKIPLEKGQKAYLRWKKTVEQVLNIPN